MARGRPPLSAEQKKDRNLTFRTRNGLREKLAAAAEAHGRSISEEIEHRLNESFATEN
jgi:predicted HicB family RNase H-like nuclease